MARKQRPDLAGTTPEGGGPPTDDAVEADEFVGPPAPPRDAPAEPPAPPPVAAAAPEAQLEDRLRRLEATLTQLQQIEQRLVAIQNAPVATAAPPPPMAVATAPSEKNSLLSSAASLISAGTSLLPSILTKGDPNRSRDPFSLSETVAELRAMHHMLVDPRYSMSWLGRVALPLLLLTFVFSGYLMPGASIPVVGWVVEKVWLLALSYALFKVLAREARRYREKAPDLPPSLRL